MHAFPARRRKLAVLVIATFSLAAASSASAATITVDDSGGADHLTIQDAVAAASAGDTIDVAAGAYSGTVTVSAANVTISGANAADDPRDGIANAQSVLDGAISLTGDGDAVLGMTVTNSPAVPGAGIAMSELASGYTIRNNYVHSNIIGIYLQSSGTVASVVEQNLIESNNDAGSGTGTGIWGQLGTANVDIQNNTFTGQDSAAVNFASGPAQSDVRITGNTFTSDNSLVITNTNGLTISDNTFASSNGSVVYLGGGNQNVTITGNTFTDGVSRGIRLSNDFSATPNDTTIITGNTFQNMGDGLSRPAVQLTASGYNAAGTVEVHHNRFAGNSYQGILNDASNGAVIDANDNWWGCNTGPNTVGCDTVTGTGSTLTTDRLQLVASADPTDIHHTTGTSAITAKLQSTSLAATVPSDFPATTIPFGTSGGSLSSPSVNTTNGVASSTLTAPATLGTVTTSATLDSETETADVEIEDIIRVDAADANSDTSGCGWSANPCDTITKGLSVAVTDDTVSVAPGTYNETATFPSGFLHDDITLTGDDANNRPVITGGMSITNTSQVIDGLTLANLIVRGEVTNGTKHMVISMQGSIGIRDLTVDNLVIDGENQQYGPGNTEFGGRTGLWGYNLGGAVRIEDTVFENLKGYCAFDTNCNGGVSTFPDSIEFVRNTLRNSSGAIALRGGHITSPTRTVTDPIDTVLVEDSTFENIGPDDNSYGGALKLFAVTAATVTDSSFSGVGSSAALIEGNPMGIGVSFRGVSTLDITGSTFTNNRQAISVDQTGWTMPTGAITGNTLSGNAHGLYVPASTNLTNQPTIARNRIVSSGTASVHNGTTGSLNVEDNWWGCNSGCVNSGGPGTVDADPNIVLETSAIPGTVQLNGLSGVSADLIRNSDGETVDDLNSATDSSVPPMNVSFAEIGGPLGSLQDSSLTTDMGQTGTIFTAGATPGTATVRVTADSEQIDEEIVIQTAPVGDGDAEIVPDNPPNPVDVSTGATADANDPVAGTVTVPAGGNGGLVTIEEIDSGDVEPGDQPPSAYSVVGTTVEIKAPDQTREDPLVLTFVIYKPASAITPDEEVSVFRNGDELSNCTSYPGATEVTAPDVACVESRVRNGDELTITVLAAQASLWAVGAPALETVFDDGPGPSPSPTIVNPTNDPSPTFEFHAVDTTGPTEVSAAFECQIDGSDVVDSPCTTSTAPTNATYTLNGIDVLANDGSDDGYHTFTAQANDGFAAGPPEDRDFFLDTVDPAHTGFTAGPGFANGPSHLSNATSGTVTWTRSDAAPSSGFDDTQCNLDGAGFADCSTGTSQVLPPSGLTQGPHTLEVQVVDNAGNVDATTATYSYEIDIVAPQTVIDSYLPLADPSNSPSASFTYSTTDSEAGQAPQPPSLPATFQCRLDTPAGNGAWTACNLGNITYPGPLADGLHTFRVRATDSAGNQDGSEATRSWTVDRTLPVITLRYPRDGGWYSKYKDVESDWDCTDTAPGIVAGTTSTVPEGQAFPRATPGTNNFEITCTDNAGNVATSSTTYEIKEFHEIVNHDSPVAYYRLNEPSGDDTLSDFSGNNHDGEFKNATAGEPFGISGDNDTARAFFGEGGYGYVNGIYAPKFSHTLGGWVRFDDTGDAEILDHGYEAGIYLEDQRFAYRMMGVSVTDPGPAVVANQWYFVAGRWTGGQIQLWRTTGAPGIHTLPTMVASASQANRPSSQSTFYIGYGQDVPWLRGQMDEVFYYDSALSTHHLNELWLADPPAQGKSIASHSADSAVIVASKGAKAKAKATAQVKRLSKSLASAKRSLAKLKRQFAPLAQVKAATKKVKRLQAQLRRAKARVRSL